MRSFMDSLFRGILEIVNTDVVIKLKTKFTKTERDNKNFNIRVLNYGDVESNNAILLQKYNDEAFVSSLILIDWDTGNVTNYTKHSFPVIQPISSEHPPVCEGGLYYNSNTKTWYKSDGNTWTIANI